jgi:hypothetical protein
MQHEKFAKRAAQHLEAEADRLVEKSRWMKLAVTVDYPTPMGRYPRTDPTRTKGTERPRSLLSPLHKRKPR